MVGDLLRPSEHQKEMTSLYEIDDVYLVPPLHEVSWEEFGTPYGVLALARISQAPAIKFSGSLQTSCETKPLLKIRLYAHNWTVLKTKE